MRLRAKAWYLRQVLRLLPQPYKCRAWYALDCP